MNKQTFLQIQTLELQNLLEAAGDDPILAPQLRERLDDAQKNSKRLAGKRELSCRWNPSCCQELASSSRATAFKVRRAFVQAWLAKP